MEARSVPLEMGVAKSVPPQAVMLSFRPKPATVMVRLFASMLGGFAESMACTVNVEPATSVTVPEMRPVAESRLTS